MELVEVDVVQRVTIRTTDITQQHEVERPGMRVAIAVEPGDSGAMVHLPGGGVGIVWSRSTTTADQAWTVDLPADLLDTVDAASPDRSGRRRAVPLSGCPDPISVASVPDSGTEVTEIPFDGQGAPRTRSV